MDRSGARATGKPASLPRGTGRPESELTIDDLKAAVRNGRVRVTDHADEEARSGRLTLEDVFSSLLHGEIVEEYARERPYPTWHVFGRTTQDSPVHSVWGCSARNGWAVLIRCTVPEAGDRPAGSETK